MRTFWIFFVTLMAFSVVWAMPFQNAPAKAPDTTAQKPGAMKPYSQVITKEAKTDTGLFIVHRIKEKLFFEIPKNEFGKEFLLVTSQAKTLDGMGFGGDGINQLVVRWERVGDKMMLKSVLHSVRSVDSLPIAYGVRKITNAPILMAFDIQTFNKDSSNVVIEATDIYLTDVAEFGLGKFQREQYKVRRLDSKRSYLDFCRSYPDNIEAEATLTYDAGSVPQNPSLSSMTLTLHHSMVRLPEKPMMPRLFDSRIGYFTHSQYDYAYDSHRAENRIYIARFRLEPKDPDAIKRGGLSEPVKPIVFYIDRAFPEKWKIWAKKGVEDWQPAFEKAGFKNAIIGKYAPSEKEDPEWNGEDARYSTVRWLPSSIENAYGPHISDPRSGEVLDADIGIYHNVMNLARNWYFVQVGNLDPRAKKLPLPDDLMGELLRYIIAHEVGHSLGFQHNFKATAMYPVDSLRSKSFTEKYGNEASIMDYGRFNYVAQPGDQARLIPILGPYDNFAVEWGYKPMLGAKTPEEEKVDLNKIATRQETEPYLRWGAYDSNDPMAQTEDMGDDAVKATKYGMKNIYAIVEMLLTATTKDGEDYSTLKEIYNELLSQRNRELGHVANYIGGVIHTERIAGIKGVIHEPVSRERQKESMEYLQKEGFMPPLGLLKIEILALIDPTGAVDRVLAGQNQLLNILLTNSRMSRLVNAATLVASNKKLYTLAEMLNDLRVGIWSELNSGSVKIGIYRRNLQRSFIDMMGNKLNPPAPAPAASMPPGIIITGLGSTPGEAKALIRSELIDLEKQVLSALPKSGDRETKAHLQDSKDQLAKILRPNAK
ncbi:MAG: zinc-dependent metalloprotease [bacterium]